MGWCVLQHSLAPVTPTPASHSGRFPWKTAQWLCSPCSPPWWAPPWEILLAPARSVPRAWDTKEVLQLWAGRTEAQLCLPFLVPLGTKGVMPLEVQGFLSSMVRLFYRRGRYWDVLFVGSECIRSTEKCSRAFLDQFAPSACLQGSVAIWCLFFEHCT